MNVKSTLFIVLLLSSSWGSLWGQNPTYCLPFNQQVALADIKAGTPKLFLAGGIAPVRRARDASVEKQFGFYYQDFGCIRPTNEACLREYSQAVFGYLDKKYGKTWRTNVRKEVLFLSFR